MRHISPPTLQLVARATVLPSLYNKRKVMSIITRPFLPKNRSRKGKKTQKGRFLAKLCYTSRQAHAKIKKTPLKHFADQGGAYANHSQAQK
jgi:hypothetical protein